MNPARTRQQTILEPALLNASESRRVHRDGERSDSRSPDVYLRLAGDAVKIQVGIEPA